MVPSNIIKFTVTNICLITMVQKEKNTYTIGISIFFCFLKKYFVSCVWVFYLHAYHSYTSAQEIQKIVGSLELEFQLWAAMWDAGTQTLVLWMSSRCLLAEPSLQPQDFCCLKWQQTSLYFLKKIISYQSLAFIICMLANTKSTLHHRQKCGRISTEE